MKVGREWLLDELSELTGAQAAYLASFKAHGDHTNDPELRAGWESIRRDHEAQQSRMRTYLSLLGRDATALEKVKSTFLGTLAGAKALVDRTRDTDYRNLVDDAIIEQLCIGANTTMIAVAEALADAELLAIMQENLVEDQQHFAFLDRQIKILAVQLATGDVMEPE